LTKNSKYQIPHYSIYGKDAIFAFAVVKVWHYRDPISQFSATNLNFPIHKPWYQLSEEQKSVVWDGKHHFTGLNDFF